MAHWNTLLKMPHPLVVPNKPRLSDINSIDNPEILIQRL
jgi:hypothetical protein